MRFLLFAIAMLALIASPPASAEEGCASTHVDGPIVTADVAHGDDCAHTLRVCTPVLDVEAKCRAV